MANVDPNANLTDCSWRKASWKDETFIKDRMRKESQTVGFIPYPTVEYYGERGLVEIAEINGDPAGLIILTGGSLKLPVLRIAIVERELWRKTIGTAATKRARQIAEELGWDELKIRTRVDVEWQMKINEKCGGKLIAIEPGGTRKKPVSVWKVPTAEITQQESEAGHGDEKVKRRKTPNRSRGRKSRLHVGLQ